MIYQIIYILEILIIICCIYCVYDATYRLSWRELVIILLLLVMVNATKSYPVFGSIVLYAALEGYCLIKFRRRIKEHITNFVIFMTTAALVEFCGYVLVSLLIKDNKLFSALLTEIMGLVISVFFLKRAKLNKLAEWACNKNIVLYMAVIYIGLLVFAMIGKFKVYGGFIKDNYIWFVPLVIFIILLSRQYMKYHQFYEEKERELEAHIANDISYRKYLDKIRVRQHEVNNHLSAILAMHYTKPTYEELVKAQEAYCKHIISENRYNVLLKLQESILIGFLYDKFSAIEAGEVSVKCEIVVGKYKPAVPEYYMVEMLGILLDNAAEAAIEWDCFVGCECIRRNDTYMIETIIETKRGV